jgi:4,5:9,10-diseco-3-hydroxy-5,9,17-trioxoandrosta-1(10),2-diene-4-oate hydrolase
MSEEQIPDLFIKLNGIKARYWEVGTDGSPVLFIHGLGGFIENWEPNIGAFSQHHRVYAVDLVGCGLTEKPDVPYSISYLADFVLNFLVSKNIRDVSVIGASLGAGIAIELYLRKPEIVNKLVLLGGLGFAKEMSVELRVSSLPVIGEYLMKPNPDGVEQYLKLLFHDHDLVTDELINFSFERSDLPGAPEAYLATLRSTGNLFGMKRKIIQRTIKNAGQIEVPVFIGWGREDKFIPVEQAYLAEKLFPDATLHIFENCGHLPNIECAEEFNRIALSFLAGIQ